MESTGTTYHSKAQLTPNLLMKFAFQLPESWYVDRNAHEYIK